MKGSKYIFRIFSILTMVYLFVYACDVQLTRLEAPALHVQIKFTQPHENVTATWTGTIVDDRYDSDIPADMSGLNTNPIVDLPLEPTVVRNQTVNFPGQQLKPAIWDITVEIREGGDVVDTILCEDVDIKFAIRPEGEEPYPFGLTVTEGLTDCTSVNGGVSAPYIPPQNVAVFMVTDHETAEQGDVIAIVAQVLNQGEGVADFELSLVDNPPAGGNPGIVIPTSQSVTNLEPGEEPLTFTFEWRTAGASFGVHDLVVSAPQLPNEPDAAIGNNTDTDQITITAGPEHDLEVVSVTVPTPVIQGQNYIVSVALQNNGDVEETFTFNLTDTPQGGTETPVDTSPPITLPPEGTPGNATTVTLPWSTSGIAAGTHTLTAEIPVLPSGEASTINNRKITNVNVELHDVEVVSLTNPASANIGDPVTVTASVRNNGNVNEGNIEVSLVAQPPGGGTPIPLETITVSVNSGATTPVNFTWNTACISPAGNYTLTATASVLNDNTPANNSATGTPLNMVIDHELSIDIMSNPGTVTGGSGVSLIVNLINNNSVAESGIDVNLTDTPAAGPPGPIQKDPRLPINIGCGETIELIFTWFPPSAFTASHDLTATITTNISGDNPADNTDTITVNVQ
jgi:uncharacterized repeat protein (TIGR01451 family)